jgi:hypothetical protein
MFRKFDFLIVWRWQRYGLRIQWFVYLSDYRCTCRLTDDMSKEQTFSFRGSSWTQLQSFRVPFALTQFTPGYF